MEASDIAQLNAELLRQEVVDILGAAVRREELRRGPAGNFYILSVSSAPCELFEEYEPCPRQNAIHEAPLIAYNGRLYILSSHCGAK